MLCFYAPSLRGGLEKDKASAYGRMLNALNFTSGFYSVLDKEMAQAGGELPHLFAMHDAKPVDFCRDLKAEIRLGGEMSVQKSYAMEYPCKSDDGNASSLGYKISLLDSQRCVYSEYHHLNSNIDAYMTGCITFSCCGSTDALAMQALLSALLGRIIQFTVSGECITMGREGDFVTVEPDACYLLSRSEDDGYFCVSKLEGDSQGQGIDFASATLLFKC